MQLMFKTNKGSDGLTYVTPALNENQIHKLSKMLVDLFQRFGRFILPENDHRRPATVYTWDQNGYGRSA